MSALLYDVTDGDIFDGAAFNAANDQIEASFDALGPYVISGLAVTAGTGLAVDVALGVAFVGGYVNKAAGFSISGLTPSTTNHLYLLQAGTGTANTSGTAPANSVKLGTALTDGSSVLSVAQTRASGRQLLVRHEDLTLGGGAGNPAAGDLSSWHASNTEGNQFRGVLPTGAVPSPTAPLTLTLDDTNQTSMENPLILRHTYSAGAGAAGIGSAVRFEAETTTGGTSQLIGRVGFYTTNDTIANLTSAFKVMVQANAIEFEKFRVEADHVLIPTVPTSTQYPLLALGSNYAGGAGDFAGSASGTFLGSNADGSFAGNLFDFQVGGASYFKASKTALTVHDAFDVVVGSTTGTKIATATTQKLGLWGVTPVVQPVSNSEIRASLIAIGAIAGGINDLNTNGGNVICKQVQMSEGFVGSGQPVRALSNTITPGSDADVTVSTPNSDFITQKLAAGSWASGHNVILPTVTDALYLVHNNSGFSAVFKTAAGTGVTVATGMRAWIQCGGANYIRITADAS